MAEFKDYTLTAKVAGTFKLTLRAPSESNAISCFLEELEYLLNSAAGDGLDLRLTSAVDLVPDKDK